MAEKARAMVLTDFGAPLEYREYLLPALNTGEVLAEITAAGVCGSDIHMWQGKDSRTPLPIILGHEGAGRVVAIRGKKNYVNSNPVKEGDLILWHRGISCGQCYFCVVKKEPSLCSDRLVYGINQSCADYPHLKGCYASHILLDAKTNLFKLPGDIDPAVMVSATCSGSTAAHAFALSSPRPGDVVLVQGPGPLGLFAIALAKACGASEIIVTGGTEKRLELCLDFGATVILDRNNTTCKERAEKIYELTDGRGVDYAIEAVGIPEAVREGIELVCAGGCYVSMGFGEPRGTITLDCFQNLVRKNLHLQGVWVSDASHTFMAMEMIRRQPDLFARMITHQVPLEKANEALQLMAQKKAVKAVIMNGLF